MLSERISHNYEKVPIDDTDNENNQPTTTTEGNTITNSNNSIKSMNDENNDSENEETFDAYIFLLQIGENKKRIGINSNWRVLQIKQRYFQSDLLSGRNIRLIYRGQILDDYKNVMNDYHISDGSFVHVSIANNIGCQSQLLKENEFNKQPITNTFDDGLNDAEIAQRLQEIENNNFRNFNSSNVQSIDIQNISNGLWATENNNGSNNSTINAIAQRRDFICGFFMGLMVGVWVYFILLFVRRSYSRRFRLGVLCGVMLNITIELFNHQTNHLESNDASNGIPPVLNTSGNIVNDANSISSANE